MSEHQAHQKREADAQQKRDEERARRYAGAGEQQGGTPQDADEVMAIRKQAGSIAEVIEPVIRTRLERTDR
jgi:hypothetical protein